MVLWVMTGAAFAHGPTPQKAKATIEIQASVNQVWALLKQFDAIAKWHPELKHSTGDGQLASGGSRTVTFNNGGELTDELDFYSEQDHEYSYRLKKENPAVFPVSSYSVTVQVLPGASDNSSQVVLKSRFYRGDTGNNPVPEQNDEAAVKAMNDFFTHGLSGLKKALETGQ